MLENKALLDDPLPHLWCPAKAILQGWSLATTSGDHPNLIPTAGTTAAGRTKHTRSPWLPWQRGMQAGASMLQE